VTAGARVLRNVVVQAWGTPAVTVGSVNEPREMAEQGVRFNEKWVYRLGSRNPEQPTERVIYWLRYDLVACHLVFPNGKRVAEDLAVVLAGRRDRRFHPADVARAD